MDIIAEAIQIQNGRVFLSIIIEISVFLIHFQSPMLGLLHSLIIVNIVSDFIHQC